MSWELWKRQILAIQRLEWKKNFFARRALWIWLLALGPVLITWGHSLIPPRRGYWRCSLEQDATVFAGIFQLFYLRLGIFFGCAGIFTNLFRGELLERTLHYYLLAPVRREVLAVAKFASGLLAAFLFFVGSVALSWFGIFNHFGAGFQDWMWHGPGLGQFTAYAGAAALGCVGYGAVFLLMGMKFRNPMVPAAVIMVWEGILEFLPPFLQKCSVVYYLQSLTPVQIPINARKFPPLALLATVVEPVPGWVAVTGVLGVSAVLIGLVLRRARGLEVSYGGE